MEELKSLDREGQLSLLARELPNIREELSITPDDLERMTNIGAKRVAAIEDGRQELKWSEYLTIIFVLWANEKSRGMLDKKGLFPVDLKRAFSVNNNAHEPTV